MQKKVKETMSLLAEKAVLLGAVVVVGAYVTIQGVKIVWSILRD